MLVGSGTRDSTALISAVLGTPDEATRDADTLKLLDYGFSRYHPVQPVKLGEQLADPKLDYRSDHLSLVAKRGLQIDVREGQHVATRVTAPDQISGAVKQDQVLGHVTVTVDGRRAGASPLIAAHAVGAATTLDKVTSVLDPLVLLALAAIVILVGLLVMRRGRGPKEPEVATPRPRNNQRQAPQQRTAEERRRMHEERMRRRRQRMEREGGTG